MTRNPRKLVRTTIRYTFYVWCVLVIVSPIFICGPFLLDPMASFAGRSEFTDVAGPAAKNRLTDWPASVDPRNVQAMSFKSQYSRDSFSSWYRIEVDPKAGEKWMDEIHRQENDWWKTSDDLIEGVNRFVPGPPPLHRQTGETPDWWNPPRIEFRATEIMFWYANYDSGVGTARYSAFDQSTGVLWIYDYSCQHDLLWSRGKIPEGDVFTNIEH